MIDPEIAHLAIPIDSVRPHPRNPNNGDTEAITESLRINHQFRPIVVNRRTREILAGNHTWAAALELGWGQIAATFVDADDEQAVRIMIADNRSARLARPDDAAIAELLVELPFLAGTGYDDAALADLLAALDLPLDLDEVAQPKPEAKGVTCPACGCEFTP